MEYDRKKDSGTRIRAEKICLADDIGHSTFEDSLYKQKRRVKFI